VAAQSNGVTVSGLAISAGTVTFNVSWNKTTMPVALWSDTVWVFVDYNKAGKMERLPVTAAIASAGTVTMAPNNNKGVWVIGNARSAGSFSATVTLLTATATATGACAYASNYPPVGEYISTTQISFTGTPMYDIVLKHSNGSTITVQSGGTFLLPCSYTVASFTDITRAPGLMKCIPMTGSIDFTVPAVLPKNTKVSFVLNKQPTAPNSASVTYRWTAPNFSPATYAGHTYTPTVPASGTYPVTLTAQSEGYCDLVITKNVVVLNCDVLGTTGITFAAFSPCTGASYGATYTLIDDRDQKTYKVKYMPDGRYWMAQNLAFGNCNASSWKNDNSEAATTVTPTVASGYVGHCRTSTISGAGYYYSFAAAMNNRKAYNGSSDVSFECTGTGVSANACRGICPSGWHLPTGKTNGEFYTLHTALVSYAKCSNQNCWLSPAMPEFIGSGIVYSTNAPICNQYNGYAYYTSTSANANYAYLAHWCSKFAAGDTYYEEDKSWGSSVRCVKNY
jgi:uncharacterized protein (TIGR02145 family)